MIKELYFMFSYKEMPFLYGGRSGYRTFSDAVFSFFKLFLFGFLGLHNLLAPFYGYEKKRLILRGIVEIALLLLSGFTSIYGSDVLTAIILMPYIYLLFMDTIGTFFGFKNYFKTRKNRSHNRTYNYRTNYSTVSVNQDVSDELDIYSKQNSRLISDINYQIDSLTRGDASITDFSTTYDLARSIGLVLGDDNASFSVIDADKNWGVLYVNDKKYDVEIMNGDLLTKVPELTIDSKSVYNADDVFKIIN